MKMIFAIRRKVFAIGENMGEGRRTATACKDGGMGGSRRITALRKIEYQRLVGIYRDVGSAHVDGIQTLRNALATERSALEAYAHAVRAFSVA